MPIDLDALLDPRHSAVVTSELQNSVVGERSALPELAAAAAPIIPNVARLCAAARAAGIPVVHGVAARRGDGQGSNANARLFLGVRRSPVTMEPGSADVAVVPALGPDPADLVLCRLHGLDPMAGTDLDPILRNLGVTTLVVTGVSVNVAITNLVMDAVNRGYQVVLPRDAVAGLPAGYVDAVIEHTISLLATVITTADVLAVWAAVASGGAVGP